jgi:hypothetical protein
MRGPIDHVAANRRKRRHTYDVRVGQISQLTRLIRYRHGRGLDTDDADAYLVPIAKRQYLKLRLRKPVADAGPVCDLLQTWAENHAPQLPERVLRAAAEHAFLNPRLESAETLGRTVRLTYAERTLLKINSIGSHDVSKADRARLAKERRRARDRDRKAAKRLAQDMTPRNVYLAESLSRTRPWEAEGISRRTWERRRRAKIVAEVAA